MAPLARSRTAMKGNWLKLLLVLAAAVCFVAAVLLPDTLPEFIRKLMGLGSGDDTAATPWLRWVLVAAGLGLLLLARRWEQVAWADVALLVVIGLTAAALLGAFQRAQERSTDEIPETTAFSIPAEKAIAAVQLPRASSIILLAVEPEKADTGVLLTYASTRYEATLCHALGRGPARRDVAITVDRGDDEANAAAFAADLFGAKRVHLLPAVKKATAETSSNDEAKDSDDAKGKKGAKAASAVPAELPAACPKQPAKEPIKPKPAPCQVKPKPEPKPKPDPPPKEKPKKHRQCPRS